MKPEEVKTLFKETIEEMKLEGITLRLVPMKRKIASFSFRTKTLRLNRWVIETLDPEIVKYIILHELVHFKLNDVNHGKEFLEEFGKFYTAEDTKRIETKLIRKLISTRILKTTISSNL
jgi:hypothetical protein